MKRKTYLLVAPFLALLALGSCTSDNDQVLLAPREVQTTKTFTEVLALKKDKARYAPGEEVSFSVNGTHQNTVVRYKYLNQLLEEHPLSGTSWTWTPPADDFRGYMVELVKTTSGEETLLGTVGVDVSTDWTRFPRYGFLSEFGNVPAPQRAGILDNLKDFHINGLQYYDWHSKHHIPLPREDGSAAAQWQDLFNRPIRFETVEGYIEQAHDKNIASMFYNLLFGVWNPENGDGISEQWFMYNDRNRKDINKHVLSGFGDILLTDPSNPEWQEYIFDQTQWVYENLEFDGWHLDQLGNRGNLYDFNGYQIPVEKSYQDFLTELSQKFPQKKMVLNAVDQYAQEKILSTPVDFAYSEIWSRHQYQDLAQVILENNKASNGQLNTVLAAYVNYEAQEGSFNTPGVLLADAVIFAFGGAHLELGEHMLSSEYFPNTKLQMEPELKSALKEYYDFLVAYQNLLRDGGSFHSIQVKSLDAEVTVNQWPPIFSQTSAVTKQMGETQVVHLLNFDGASTLQWRDDSRIQTVPSVKASFEVQIEAGKQISRVWFASPDINGGASQELQFTQNGTQVILEVPYLQYWSMLVLE